MEDYGETDFGEAEAEEYLEQIADDIPLFTNTREGVFNTPAAPPAPMEAHSALADSGDFLSPLRQQLMQRMSQRKLLVADTASEPRMASVQDRVPAIADLQLEDSEEDEMMEERLVPAKIVPSKTKMQSSVPSPNNIGGFASSEKQYDDGRDVSPHVVQGLVQIMRDGVHEKRKKSTIAMCNLCCGSLQNRQYAHEAGVVPVLVAMMKDADEHMQRLATACVCNLSADPPLKDAFAEAGAIPYLSRIVESKDTSADARAATAHAAATLWSLCADMDHIKPMVAQDETLSALIAQLTAPEAFVRGQVCGCLGEVFTRYQEAKDKVSSLNIIPVLIKLLDEDDPATQRLAASALCNLSANHDENKSKSREAGLVDTLIKLLKTSSDDAVRSAAAGGLYNLVTKQDREKLEQNNVVEIMQQVPAFRDIDIRLGKKKKKKRKMCVLS